MKNNHKHFSQKFTYPINERKVRYEISTNQEGKYWVLWWSNKQSGWSISRQEFDTYDEALKYLHSMVAYPDRLEEVKSWD